MADLDLEQRARALIKALDLHDALDSDLATILAFARSERARMAEEIEREIEWRTGMTVDWLRARAAQERGGDGR